jgi:hypothetical protein
MKKIVVLIYSILFLSVCLSAQKNELITVKAGTKVLDYFPVKDRFRFPEFIEGKVLFKNGVVNTAMLNYDYLTGEIEFIQSRDTLSIIRKKELRMVLVAQDTFFFDNGYIELISGGKINMGLKQYVKIKDVLKKGAYGTTARGVSIESYNSMESGGKFYELIPNEDIVLENTHEYYLSIPSSGFVTFRKKNVLQLFPQKVNEIQKYLKFNKVNFDSKDDLLRLAAYLDSL